MNVAVCNSSTQPSAALGDDAGRHADRDASPVGSPEPPRAGPVRARVTPRRLASRPRFERGFRQIVVTMSSLLIGGCPRDASRPPCRRRSCASRAVRGGAAQTTTAAVASADSACTQSTSGMRPPPVRFPRVASQTVARTRRRDSDAVCALRSRATLGSARTSSAASPLRSNRITLRAWRVRTQRSFMCGRSPASDSTYRCAIGRGRAYRRCTSDASTPQALVDRFVAVQRAP